MNCWFPRVGVGKRLMFMDRPTGGYGPSELWINFFKNPWLYRILGPLRIIRKLCGFSPWDMPVGYVG